MLFSLSITSGDTNSQRDLSLTRLEHDYRDLSGLLHRYQCGSMYSFLVHAITPSSELFVSTYSSLVSVGQHRLIPFGSGEFAEEVKLRLS